MLYRLARQWKLKERNFWVLLRKIRKLTRRKLTMELIIDYNSYTNRVSVKKIKRFFVVKVIFLLSFVKI